MHPKIKINRTGVQPVYHEKELIIRTGGSEGYLNFNKANTQFEWTIILIQPVFQKNIEISFLLTEINRRSMPFKR